MTFVSNHGIYNSGTYIPFNCTITGIASVLNTTVVTTNVNHGYVVGNEVQFVIPKQWGMRQLDGLTGLVLSIPGPNQIAVNINSSTFDAFVTPTVTLPVVIDNAQVLGIGDQNTGYQYTGSPPTLQIPGSFRNTYP